MSFDLICIVATDLNGGIGIDNKIPWKIPAEMAHFKKATSGKPVIMGRKTWESLPAPLNDRLNIVITSADSLEGAIVARTPHEALAIAEEWWKEVGYSIIPKEVYVIGGAQIYKAFEALYDKVILTRVASSFLCDTHFDDSFMSEHLDDWSHIIEEYHVCDKSKQSFRISEYVRNQLKLNL